MGFLPPQSQPLYLYTYASYIHIILLKSLQYTFANQYVTNRFYIVCLNKYYIHLYLYLCTNTDIKFAPNRSKPQMMSKHVVTQCSTTNVGRDAGCQDMLSNINLYVNSILLLPGYAELIHLLIRKLSMEPKEGPFEKCVPA